MSMEAEEDIVPPPYGLEDVAPHAESAFSLRKSDLSLDSEYSHGLHLGRAPQLRSGFFVGRETELKRLSDLLLPGSLTRNVVAIAAAGGLGKTQLAITYAERYHRNYSSVFWLDAKDESTLKQELAGLADIILDPAQTSAATSVDEDNNTIKQVKSWFSLPHNNHWLLILDNYDDPKLPGLNSVTGYDIRSYFPSRNHGSILITTRLKKLNFAKCLELGKLETIAQGLKILSIRSDLDLSLDPHAKALATRLAGFPLALATAGAYLGQSSGGCSAQEYLTLYDQQWDELEENADVLLEYEDRTLFSTWNLSLEQVRKQNSNAAMMLRFLAFFGNSGITFELFRTTRDMGKTYRLDWLNDLTKSKVIFNKAMATLQNYSLIEYMSQGYFLHTCLHDWTLHALNKSMELDYFWDAMLCIATNVHGNVQKHYWHNNQLLLRHATRLWQIRLKNPSTTDVCNGMQTYCLQWAGYLWSQHGSPIRAEAILLSALNAYETLYRGRDTKTLSVVVCLADTYKMMDRYIEAEDMYWRALRACENVSMPDKSVPSRVRHNLALTYQRQGKLAEAEQMLREALAGFEVSLGPESYEAPQTANVLAAVLLQQRRFLDAEALSEKAVEGLTKALSPEHPLTLTAMATRGEVHFHQEQWEQAEALYITVLQGRERVLGSEHKETRQAARYLGGIYAKRQELDKLVKLTQRWKNKESSLYTSLARLGRTFLKAEEEQQASIAFQRSLHVVNGATCWSALCDGCAGPEILLTPSKGLFICRQCDEIDLCRECYEMHQAGTKMVESCVGHSFFEVPVSTLDQAASPPEQP